MAKLVVLPKRLEVLEVSDPACSFRVNIDVLNEAFGIGRSMYAKAVYPDTRNGVIPGTAPNEKYIIWMPKLYGNNSEWKNVLSEDGTELYEVAEGDRHQDWIDEEADFSVRRLVFTKKDVKSPYVFSGVFKCGKMEHCNHTFERIATKVRLIGAPANRIEIVT